MSGEAPEIPAYSDLLWATLCAVRELGHSARLDEIDEWVIERENFSEAQLAVLHNDGPRSEIEYRLAWARTYLKGMGALTNVSRGVWATTGLGRELSADEIEPLWRKHQAERRAQRRREADAVEADVEPDANGTEADRWKEQLLEQMLTLSPAGFERLAQRLLREEGFVNPTVTGRSGDGGIDGTGAYRLSLVSFPVFFQCKRYKGTVGPDKVRDFRGAMSGRGDRGLLITTGSFTPGAREEATRDGAPPIDLIDGEQLCELLKKHQLGVRVAERVVEDIEVVESFFGDLG
ncbi:MAG TPA: restriction endonuclease [Solirubrobacterales bacterium]|nr:restriction endonuclease [Solirubrobacterales bacterium]